MPGVISQPCAEASAPPAGTAKPPLLVLLLDGVAYDRFAAVYEQGHFRRFRPPAKLISVFPTLTDPAFDVLFGTGPTPGYEAGYYERRTNRTINGLPFYLRGGNEAWVRHSDFRLSFLLDAIMYLFPRAVFRSELRRAARVFARKVGRRHGGGRPDRDHQTRDLPVPDAKVIYILSTDGLGHMLGADQIERELLRIDAWIDERVDQAGGTLDVVLLSDHGLGAVKPTAAGTSYVRRFDLPAVLRAAGLNLVSRLQEPGDVVFPHLGLLDVARFHTIDDATRERVVTALRDRPEVELISARVGDRVRVLAGTAEGTILARSATDSLTENDLQFRYDAHRGDPLRLASTIEWMQARGMLDGDGFASPDAWLAATAEAEFPDAPRRLWEGMFTLCHERPDVVVSLTDAWYVGSGLLSPFVRMKGTHGGLHRRDTVTFATSTRVNLPSPIDLRGLARVLRAEFGWPGNAERKAQSQD